MRRVETRVFVRYAETDQMGVVYHANYLTWFEIGRTEWIASFGYPYAEFERRGLLLPVVEAHLTYHAPARYGDEVTIITRLSSLSGVRLTFTYEILLKKQESSTLLVEGYTKHAWVDKEFRPTALRRLWPEMASLLTQAMEEER